MNPLETELNKLKSVRLSKEVFVQMRLELSSYADLHTVNAPLRARNHASGFSLSIRLWGSFALILFILVSAGGTAFASGNSLPGDILYPVKVQITEPLQTAFIPSPRGKASWHAILAERRLEEATTLASQNKLTASTQEELAANFSSQVDSSVSNANALEHMGDSLGSLDVRSDLEARITAHEHILGVIADTMEQGTSTNATSSAETINSLLAVVSTNKEEVQASRIALENQLVPDTTASSTASTSPALAINTRHSMRKRLASAIGAPAVGVTRADTARREEVQMILAKNATILAAFTIGSTTASSTDNATSTTTDSSSTKPTVEATSTVEVHATSTMEGSTKVLFKKS